MWLKKWLEEQEPFILPDITAEAAEKLGGLIANRKWGSVTSWEAAMAMLGPYFDTGNKSENPQQQLPEKWNDLVQQLKGYSVNRRSEFLTTISHGTYPPLLPKQIKLLASLLADGDIDSTGDFYAAHLEKYIYTA